MTETAKMLKRVGYRRRAALFGRSFYRAFLVLAGLYAAVLLFSRLSGKIPDHFEPLTLLVIPAGAILWGCLSLRRPTEPELARLVDQTTDTKDLYLTAALLSQSPGDYGPLVTRDAEQRATTIKPDVVVPFHWHRRLAHVVLALVVLFVATRAFPQFDPFGDVQMAQAEEKREKDLEKGRKATKLRTAQLKKKSEGMSEESDEVAKAVEKLKNDFKKTKRGDRQGNSKMLGQQQKMLGEKWRKLNNEKLKELFSKSSNSNQQFGGMSKAKMMKWSRELQDGSTESLQKEIDAIKSELQKLAKTTDPVKKAELREKIKQRLRDLEELASNKLDSKPLAAAVKRALKELDASKRDGLSTEALEALTESMALVKMELKEVAQSAKDLQELEKALAAIQAAKKLNGQGELDGEGMEDLESLEDYQEYYEQLMAQMGEGEGQGTGGEGFGEGGEVDENDELKSKFVNEKSKAEIRPGKVLLTLKDKGLSDRGDAKQEYRESIRKVKQGVSEAIVKEQVPPGYLDGIKSYFDTLEENEQ